MNPAAGVLRCLHRRNTSQRPPRTTSHRNRNKSNNNKPSNINKYPDSSVFCVPACCNTSKTMTKEPTRAAKNSTNNRLMTPAPTFRLFDALHGDYEYNDIVNMRTCRNLRVRQHRSRRVAAVSAFERSGKTKTPRPGRRLAFHFQRYSRPYRACAQVQLHPTTARTRASELCRC